MPNSNYPNGFRGRVAVLFVGVFLLSIAGIMYKVQQAFYIEHSDYSQQQLDQTTSSIKKLFDQELKHTKRHIVSLATNPSTAQAIADFTNAWNKIGWGHYHLIQSFFGSSDTNITPSQSSPVSTISQYKNTHNRYHHWFNQWREEQGFSEFFLISQEGYVLYSSTGGAELALPLANNDSPLIHKGLIHLYNQLSSPNASHSGLIISPITTLSDTKSILFGYPITTNPFASSGFIVAALPISTINNWIESFGGNTVNPDSKELNRYLVSQFTASVGNTIFPINITSAKASNQQAAKETSEHVLSEIFPIIGFGSLMLLILLRLAFAPFSLLLKSLKYAQITTALAQKDDEIGYISKYIHHLRSKIAFHRNEKLSLALNLQKHIDALEESQHLPSNILSHSIEQLNYMQSLIDHVYELSKQQVSTDHKNTLPIQHSMQHALNDISNHLHVHALNINLETKKDSPDQQQLVNIANEIDILASCTHKLATKHCTSGERNDHNHLSELAQLTHHITEVINNLSDEIQQSTRQEKEGMPLSHVSS